MTSPIVFDTIPIWGIFFLTILISSLAFEIGFRVVKYTKKSLEHAAETPIGAIFAAILGLLAFILAFTFNFAAMRFDERSKLVLEEAIAIEQTYYRTSFLPEIYHTQIYSLLKQYTLARLEGVHYEKQLEALHESLTLQNKLWTFATKIGSEVPSTNANQLFILSVSDMMAVHAKRVMIGIYRHIPITIWYAMYFVTILAIASMGYYVGLKRNRYLLMSFALIITFSSVITLIADLDRPQEGSIKVSQQPMINFYHKISQVV